MSPTPYEPPIVVKIGGSTLGTSDTSLRDLAALHAAARPVAIVHGGGNLISEWMRRQNLAPNFVNGLRVTDAPSLDIVIAVLAGLVNKQLTAHMQNLGAPAIGISGTDGRLLQARIANPQLGYVGEIAAVDPAPVHAILAAGYIPMISPLAADIAPDTDHAGHPLNVNGDTAAGALARALRAPQVIFLTDVPGVMDTGGRVIPRLNARSANALRHAGVARGGMLPKLAASLDAIAGNPAATAHIIDGRQPGALLDCIHGRPVGTRIAA